MNEEHHRAHEHGEYHVTWCALFFWGGRCGGGYQNSIRVTFFFVLVEEGQEKKKPIELLVRSLGMTWHQPGCLPRISLFGGTAHCQWMFDDVCCFSQLVLGSNRIIMNHSLFGSTQPYKHTNHIWHHDISSLKLPLLRFFVFLLSTSDSLNFLRFFTAFLGNLSQRRQVLQNLRDGRQKLRLLDIKIGQQRLGGLLEVSKKAGKSGGGTLRTLF